MNERHKGKNICTEEKRRSMYKRKERREKGEMK